MPSRRSYRQSEGAARGRKRKCGRANKKRQFKAVRQQCRLRRCWPARGSVQGAQQRALRVIGCLSDNSYRSPACSGRGTQSRQSIGALSRHNKRYGAVVPEDSIFAERGSGSSWRLRETFSRRGSRVMAHAPLQSAPHRRPRPAAAICIVMNLGKAPHHCAASSTIRRLSVSLDLRRWPSALAVR